MLVLITLGLAVCSAAAYVWLTWNYSYWKKRRIPQIEPEVFFGSVKDAILMKENLAIVYDKLYEQLPEEPVVGMYRMRQPQLLVRDPELLKMMLIKEFSSFHDNDIDIDPSSDPVFGYNPFVIKGEKWKKARSITTSALTTSKIKTFFDNMIPACKEMVQYLKKNENKVLEAKLLGGHFTVDVVTSCVYGIATSTFQDTNSVYRTMIKKIFDLDTLRTISFMVVDAVPWLGKLLKIRFFPRDVEEFFVKIVTDAVDYRKKHSLKRNDFLQQLIDQNDKNIKPIYSMKELMAHSMTFVLDGYETSSVLISHCLDQLAQHPEVQDKLRDELYRVVPSYSELTFDHIHSFQYLDAVINETLRIRPPASVLMKRCTKDIVINWEGRRYPIDKGTSVVVPIFSIQKDPRYFEDPDAFQPERFLEEPNPTAFFPFGLGPRACLGSRFALTQIKVCIASLVMNFEIIPERVQEGSVQYAPNAIGLLIIKNGVNIKFKSL